MWLIPPNVWDDVSDGEQGSRRCATGGKVVDEGFVCLRLSFVMAVWLQATGRSSEVGMAPCCCTYTQTNTLTHRRCTKHARTVGTQLTGVKSVFVLFGGSWTWVFRSDMQQVKWEEWEPCHASPARLLQCTCYMVSVRLKLHCIITEHSIGSNVVLRIIWFSVSCSFKMSLFSPFHQPFLSSKLWLW